jgi:thiol-disulfide isomerase/thioredoxin
VVRVHGPGRFLGELSLLTGQTEFSTAVALQAGEVLAVPVDRIRGLGVGFRIVGSWYSPDTHRLRDFAMRNRLPHRFVDLENDPTAETLLRQLGVGPEDTPVIVWRDRVLRNPSNAELAQVTPMATTTATRTVTCQNCGQMNRVPAAAQGKPRCGNCKAFLPWIADAGDEDFAEIAEQATVPVLVDLWAAWCGPCRTDEPAQEGLAAAAAAGRRCSPSSLVNGSPAGDMEISGVRPCLLAAVRRRGRRDDCRGRVRPDEGFRG